MLLAVVGFFSTTKLGTTMDFIKSMTNTSVSVLSATSTAVLSADSSRTYAVFSNDSANVIYLSLGPNATSSQGVRLEVNGRYEIDKDNQYIGVVTAIASSSTSTMMVTYK